jgi:hypothetical protein
VAGMERTSLESKFKISEIITSPLLRRPLEPKRFENLNKIKFHQSLKPNPPTEKFHRKSLSFIEIDDDNLKACK